MLLETNDLQKVEKVETIEKDQGLIIIVTHRAWTRED